MIQRAIARRYAQGLFGIGIKDGNYRVYKDELDGFLSLLTQNETLYRAVTLPIHDLNFRKGIVSDIAVHMRLSTPVLNIILLLLENNRIKYLSSVIEEYSKLVDEKDNIKRGKLYSPYPIDPETLREIEDVLSEKLKKKVILTPIEDKRLIAGLKLVVDGTIIDGTIRRQLDIIKETILKE
ncbi:MAG: ATP synthase F1 subunit delta [Deltaproteobacteria bacterium]|nr:ATP synthase F1 subunit delta [Deltaproteobacteria bacterium]